MDDPSNYSHALGLHNDHFSGLLILTVNIRSINFNLDAFLVFISKFRMTVDVIVCTECWINELTPIPSVVNYNMFRTNRYINQNDGVVAYVREGIRVSAREPNYEEGNFLVLSLGSDLSAIRTYRPHCFDNPSNYI